MSVKSLLGESLKMEFRPTFHQCIHLPYQDPFIFLHLATVHLHQLHLSQLPRCLLATIVARWRITITLASLPEKLSQTSVLMILVHHFGVCIDLCLTLAPTVHKVWVVVSFNNCEYFKAGFSLGVNCHARDFLLFKLNGFLLYSTQKLKADFHSAYFVARVTFLLFKLDSFPLHSTWKLRRQKKKVARATFFFCLLSFHVEWGEKLFNRKVTRQKKLNGNPPLEGERKKSRATFYT